MKASAAAICGLVAIILLVGAPRRRAALYLGVFFLLIAANQAASAVVAAQPRTEAEILWFRMAVVFSALDPFFLFAFATVYPAPNRMGRPAPVAAVAMLCAAQALTAALRAPGAVAGVAAWAELAWACATTAIYTWVLRHTIRAGGAGLVAAALVLATVATWPRAVAAALPVLDVPPGPVSPLVGSVGGVALGLLFCRGAPRAGIVVAGLVALLPTVALLTPALTPVGSSAAPLRWLLVGGFVSVAVLRHELVGMSFRARRRASRMLIGTVALGAAGALLFATRAGLGATLSRPPTAIEVGAIVAALGLSQVFRAFVDRVAVRAFALPARPELATALDTYRAAASRVLSAGRDPSQDTELARLRDELVLDEGSARVVERMAGAGEGRLVEGALVAGRYRVLGLVGRGGSGRTFRARDEVARVDVAIKEIFAADDEAEERALREARAASAVRHANVLGLLDVVRRPGACLLVSAWQPGGSLAERVGREGALAPAEAIRLADGVLAALEAVHEAGIVHRDVKPANVLLAADGSPRLGDFGAATLGRVATRGVREPEPVGTPEFMAPEQRRGEPATPASDIFAVGLLLARCTTAPLPPRVARVVERATALDPAARFASAREMREALAELARAPG